MEFIVLPSILVLAVLALLAVQSIRVVNEYDRLVIFRFGRTGPELVKGPGLVFLIPFIDRPVRADLREQFIEVPSQTTITKDNAPINFLIYWRVYDPLRTIVNVANFAGALQGCGVHLSRRPGVAQSTSMGRFFPEAADASIPGVCCRPPAPRPRPASVPQRHRPRPRAARRPPRAVGPPRPH